MLLRQALLTPDSSLGIQLKLRAISLFYTSLLTKTYKKNKTRTTRFPRGLQTIIENNYIIDSSISAGLKELPVKATRKLARSELSLYLQQYDLRTLMKRSVLISQVKRFRLPYAFATLVLPYLQHLIIKSIVDLLIKDSWNEKSADQANILIKNLKYLTSGEMRNFELEVCYLNNYLVLTDKSNEYRNLSNESKSFMQYSIQRKFGLKIDKFLAMYREFPNSVSTINRLNTIISTLYNAYVIPYVLAFLFMNVLYLAGVQLLLHNWLFTLLSIPLSILTSYDIANNVMRTFIPPRQTLSLNPKSFEPKALVAACIPFVVSSTHDLKRIRTEMEQLKRSNTSYPHIKYFMLVDFADSFNETDDNVAMMTSELALLCRVLNSHNGEHPSFYYFLRKSVYSQQQQRFMGWERKRGKIVEFLQFLRHEPTKSSIFSDYDQNFEFTYLFTIDEGSQVSKNIIKQLLLRAENSANLPVLSADGTFVQQGYAIFQPKISSKQDFNKTYFQKAANIFEKYHTYGSTEDVTFNIFGEYYYQGKGLINIDMYRKVCVNQFPDDVLLSHDLIEGSYLRVAFINECTIFESYPSGLNSYLQRLNRWMRGDLNSVLWLFPQLKKLSIQFKSDNINFLAKVRVALNILTVFKAPLLILTPVILGVPFLGLMANWLFSQISWLVGIGKELIYFIFRKHSLSFKLTILRKRLDTWRLFEFLALPVHAANSVLAVAASFARIFITKTHTLTWVTSQRAEGGKNVISEPLLVKLLIMLVVVGILAPLYAVILAGMTLVVLIISKFLNKKMAISQGKLSVKDTNYLNKIATLTWHFFETFVTASSRYLPPDNVTKGVVSEYTSITNIGFYFLSLVCAHKLGLIDQKTFERNFKRSFETLLKLPTYQGHFYNWYHLRTLRVHGYPFLSSIDSGNFYACMVCVRQYMSKKRILSEQLQVLDALLRSMKFSYYFNKFDQLSIGYDVRKQRLSKDNYDHFASEARLAVYIAVALENVPEDTWGNLLRPYNKSGSLLSWGGTIFEYILPQLFLKTHPDSLGHRSFQSLLFSNLEFSNKFNLPWGFSESLYVDETSKAYEYKAIGVSALSRDPLQIQNKTVAPYATSLMCVINAQKAIVNFSKLEDLNLLTEYGFYEAITFSRTAKPLRIDSYMAHHQGMILASLTNALTGNKLVTLFNSYSTMDTVDYLLDEDIPNYPDITDIKSLKFSLRDE